MIIQRKVRMKSSPHGPYRLGYTRATMINYKKLYNKEIWSKSLNFIVFRLQAATRLHEAGITSNRKLACYGETVLRPCTHRPSHAGNWFGLKL